MSAGPTSEGTLRFVKTYEVGMNTVSGPGPERLIYGPACPAGRATSLVARRAPACGARGVRVCPPRLHRNTGNLAAARGLREQHFGVDVSDAAPARWARRSIRLLMGSWCRRIRRVKRRACGEPPSNRIVRWTRSSAGEPEGRATWAAQAG